MVKMAPATSTLMPMPMTNANMNRVDCGSKGAQPDNLVRASEAQPHGVHAVPVALRIGALNSVESADENHATGVQPDEMTERRRVVGVHNRWTRECVYHCSS